MRPEGSDFNKGLDERFEAVSWRTCSVQFLKNYGEEVSDDVLKDINTGRLRRNR